MVELIVPEKRVQAECLAKELARTVQKYFRDPQHRQEFSERYKAKHGAEYDWEAMRVYPRREDENATEN